MFADMNFLQNRGKDYKAVSYPYCDPNQAFYCFHKTKYRYPGEVLQGEIYRKDMGNDALRWSNQWAGSERKEKS